MRVGVRPTDGQKEEVKGKRTISVLERYSFVFEKDYTCFLICVSLNTLNYFRALGSMRPSATGPKCTSGSNKVGFNATTLMRRTVLCNKVLFLLHRTVSEGREGRSRRLGPAARKAAKTQVTKNFKLY